MNAMDEQQHQNIPASIGDGGVNDNNTNNNNINDVDETQNMNNFREQHLNKFASLFSSARAEGSDEAVVGVHHDIEMSACFSKSHLRAAQQQQKVAGEGFSNNMPVPPSISSSSLSMHTKNGQQPQVIDNNNKNKLLEIASLNMSTPFYTTPDTIVTTATTVLKNVVSTMEELVDSRLRSTVSQLVKRSETPAPCLKLLSPSRKPIQIATVITRFVSPDQQDCENMGSNFTSSVSADDMLSIPLQFKAVIDIKVFGEMSTIEIVAPVNMTAKFDTADDGLFTAIDICFDSQTLLQNMIGQARLIVKMAVTKAATLSVQIVKWQEKRLKRKQAASSMGLKSGSTHSLIGGGLESISSFDCSMNTALSKNAKHPSKGLLRNPSFGGDTAKLMRSNTNSVVRFQENCELRTIVPSGNNSSFPIQHPHQEDQGQGGNIHAGLFSWLQEDSMFLTEEKLHEKDIADAEAERERLAAPQPLRFWSTEDNNVDGGVRVRSPQGLANMTQTIFGNQPAGESPPLEEQNINGQYDNHRQKRMRMF